MRGRRRREISSAAVPTTEGITTQGVVAPERAVEESSKPGGMEAVPRPNAAPTLPASTRKCDGVLQPCWCTRVAAKRSIPSVDEDLAEDRVVTAPVDIGPVVRRYGGDRGHEAQRDEHHHDSGESDVTEAPEQGVVAAPP